MDSSDRPDSPTTDENSRDREATHRSVAEKRELLRSILQREAERGGDSSREDADASERTAPRATPASAQDGRTHPLTPGQLRLWEIERFDETRGYHNFALAYHLEGALDPELLDRAVRAVARRHAGLRARIVVADETPRFEELTDPPISLVRRSCGDGTGSCSQELLNETIVEEASQPLDPVQAPPWRCVLIDCSGGEHVLIVHFHHIIADRWSVAVFMTDLAAAYTDLTQGVEPSWPDPAPDPWSVLAALERDAETTTQIRHWGDVFETAPEMLRLRARRRGATAAGYAGERVEGLLAPDWLKGVAEFAEAESVTRFPVLFAAFASYLFTVTGQTDFVICTPVAGRQRSESRKVIGYFNNILPLRCDLSGNPSFRELVARMAATARDAHNNQEVTFQAIASLPQLQHTRVTQCLFTMQNVPGLELTLPNVAARYRDVPNGTANFDLSVFLEQKASESWIMVDHKTAVLNSSEASTLMDEFLRHTERLVRNPDTRLAELPLAGIDRRTPPQTESTRERSVNLAETKMLALWHKVFRRSDFSPDADFFDLGGDSMQAARLFNSIHDEFGVDLPLSTLFEAPTVRELVDRIGDEHWMAPWKSLVPLRTTGSEIPLFTVAGGGGNVLSYRALLEGLGPERPVYCLQARGLGEAVDWIHREEDRTIEDIAAHYLDCVRSISPTGPYVLAGHSMGGLVALEMAQMLIDQGEKVPVLVIIDHPGPNVRLTRRDWARFHFYNLSMMPGRDRWQYLKTSLADRLRGARKLLGTKSDTASSASARRAEVASSNLKALQSYEVKAFPGRLSVFRAAQGTPRILADPHAGWKGFATDGVDMYEIPGTHMSILKPPNVDVFAAKLRHCIESGLKSSG